MLTVVKAGCLASVRMGSGVVVARLEDGRWSAPAAIGIGGAGFGSQAGIEVTDFVFILNDAAAVSTFKQFGSIAFGGNASIAAGPVGRNAEAAGTASLKGVAAIFSYSKTKGLFAGISLEGSVLLARKDANEKTYGRGVDAGQILGGSVRAPPAADPLMNILHSRVFSGAASGNAGDYMYNDVPVYDTRHDDVIWNGRRGQGYGEGVQRDRTGTGAGGDDFSDWQNGSRRKTWADRNIHNAQGRQPGGDDDPIQRPATFSTGPLRTRSDSAPVDDYVYSDRRSGWPSVPKPQLREKAKVQDLGPNQALALFSFEPSQPGDLGFKKGEVITVVRRTESTNDWWTGRIGEKEGIFPRCCRVFLFFHRWAPACLM